MTANLVRGQFFHMFGRCVVAKRSVLGLVVASALLAVNLGHAQANNFGSHNGTAPTSNVFLNPSKWVEHSVVWGYLHGSYSSSQKTTFRNYAHYEISVDYDPTDLITALMSDDTVQDATFIPTWDNAALQPVARTSCIGTPTGTHPVQRCAPKTIVVYLEKWQPLSVDEKMFVLGHEYGHVVGLRHSLHCSPAWDHDSVCAGIDSSGQFENNSHPNQTGFYMGPFGVGFDNLSNHDVAHINSNY